MPSAIVTYAHRYKRPPRKKKAIALEAPAIDTKASKRSPRLPSEPLVAVALPAKSAIVTATSKRGRKTAAWVDAKRRRPR